METVDRLRNLHETVGPADEVENIRRIIREHEWQFAKSMPYIPHEYSIKAKWRNKADFNKLLSFVWKYGVEAWFGKVTEPKRYWFDHEGGYYYFVCREDLDENGRATPICVLINRGRIASYEFYEESDLLGTKIRCRVRRKLDGEAGKKNE